MFELKVFVQHTLISEGVVSSLSSRKNTTSKHPSPSWHKFRNLPPSAKSEKQFWYLTRFGQIAATGVFLSKIQKNCDKLVVINRKSKVTVVWLCSKRITHQLGHQSVGRGWNFCQPWWQMVRWDTSQLANYPSCAKQWKAIKNTPSKNSFSSTSYLSAKGSDSFRKSYFWPCYLELYF